MDNKISIQDLYFAYSDVSVDSKDSITSKRLYVIILFSNGILDFKIFCL